MNLTLAKLARRQGGAFSRRQAMQFYSKPTIDRRVGDGQWQILLPGIYRVSATPETRLMKIHAAVLYAGPGAVASHQTAASIFRIDADPEETVFVTVPHDRQVTDQSSVRVSRSRQLSGAHTTTQHRIPVTSATRTVVDLSRVLERPALDATIADGVRNGLLTVDYLRRLDARLSSRRGPNLLRDVLHDFDPEMESILEREYSALVQAAELPLGVPQYEVKDGPLLIARVDFAYVELRLAVEVDGYRYHSRRERIDRDQRRDRALARREWDVVRFTTTDIRDDQDTVVTDLAALLTARAA